MDRYEILKSMNKEIVEMQELLYNGGWYEEFDEYLINNGFRKEVFVNSYGETEIDYIKGDIFVNLYNDLEIYIGSRWQPYIIIEKDYNYKEDKTKIIVKFNE